MRQTEKDNQAPRKNRMSVCKHCGLAGHTTVLCFTRPKNRIIPKKRMRKLGKQGIQWHKTRAEWFKQNTAAVYTCYICGEQLTPKEVTLDHYYSRSRHPELRHELSNLRPCCWRCNEAKGSLSLEEYLKKKET